MVVIPRQDEMSTARPDDVALTKAAALGDRRAQKRLAERALSRVRVTVRCLAPGDRETDDLVQISLIQILRSAKTYSGQGSLAAWIDRITIRTCLGALKKRRWRELRFLLGADTGGTTHLPATEADERELRRRVVDSLGKLPLKQRLVVVLKLAHEYSVAEIAEIVEAPAETVRHRLKVGRRKLRQRMLKDRYFQERLGCEEVTRS